MLKKNGESVMKIYKADGSSEIHLKAVPAEVKNTENKGEIKKQLKTNIKKMAELQNMMFAQDKQALLIVFQAMDAAGKDSMIRRVMTGLNPQGTQVFSFRQPSQEELDHDYLWKAHKSLPERGRIGIFNRSYYEEVLVVRVHDLVRERRIPKKLITDDIWERRFGHIRDFEKYIGDNGIAIIKFFLHISKEEQMRRFKARIDNNAKNWKFSSSDLKERTYWDRYQNCYEDAINNTSTAAAPWYIIPSDNKWYARLMVSEIITTRMKQMGLKYPELSAQQLEHISEYRIQLKDECKGL